MRNLLYISLGVFLFCFLVFSTYADTDKDKKDNVLKVEKGQILTVEHGCVFCHSPKVTEEDDLIPDPDKLFSGHPSDKKLPDIPSDIIGYDKWFGLYTTGFTAWGGPWGISYAANITPHKETGIGKWSEKDFINVIRLGIHSSFKRTLMPPMPWNEINRLSDDDLEAIFKYLQTVKPIDNKVPDSVPMRSTEDIATN